MLAMKHKNTDFWLKSNLLLNFWIGLLAFIKSFFKNFRQWVRWTGWSTAEFTFMIQQILWIYWQLGYNSAFIGLRFHIFHQNLSGVFYFLPQPLYLITLTMFFFFNLFNSFLWEAHHPSVKDLIEDFTTIFILSLYLASLYERKKLLNVRTLLFIQILYLLRKIILKPS